MKKVGERNVGYHDGVALQVFAGPKGYDVVEFHKLLESLHLMCSISFHVPLTIMLQRYNSLYIVSVFHDCHYFVTSVSYDSNFFYITLQPRKISK